MAITIVDIPVSQLMPNPHNPRRDVGDVEELADSIRAQGIKQELLVTPTDSKSPEGKPLYRVVIGHRRLAAAKLAGLETVPCRIESMSERDERALMLVENTQRCDLTPLEEADGYQGLLDLGVKVKEMAEQTGRSTRLVRGRLKIAAIPQSVRDASKDFAQLSLSDLEAVTEFDGDEDTQKELLSFAGTPNWQWKLDNLRTRRETAKWMEAARLWMESNNLPLLDKKLKPAQSWQTPNGYRFARNSFVYDARASFAKQWQAWRTEHKQEVVLCILENGIAVYELIPQQEETEDTAKHKAKDEEKRREKERKAKLREFTDTAERLRIEWIHEHVPGMKKDMLRELSERLCLISIMGIGEGKIRPVPDFDYGWTDALTAYSGMTKPLPSPANPEDDDPLWFNTDENGKELRRRQQANPTRELALLLFAHIEAAITVDTWDRSDARGRYDGPMLNAYYAVLESAGYTVSDAERKGLEL